MQPTSSSLFANTSGSCSSMGIAFCHSVAVRWLGSISGISLSSEVLVVTFIFPSLISFLSGISLVFSCSLTSTGTTERINCNYPKVVLPGRMMSFPMVLVTCMFIRLLLPCFTVVVVSTSVQDRFQLGGLRAVAPKFSASPEFSK